MIEYLIAGFLIGVSVGIASMFRAWQQRYKMYWRVRIELQKYLLKEEGL